MAKLLDTLMNRVIKGKLVTEDGDVISKEQIESAVAEVVNEMIPEIEPSLKASAIEFDTNKDDYTQAELREIISHQVLYLVNEENYFYKGLESADTMVFIHLDVRDDSTESYLLECLEFAVDSETGVVSMPDLYSYDYADLIEYYLVNADVVAKTLKQTEANWELELNLTPYDAEKTSISKAYAKISVVNGIMYIVISCTNTNITESTQTIQSFEPMVITIPSSIGSKIYDEDGNDLTTSGTNKIISSAYVRQGTATSFSWLYHQGANKLKIQNPYNGATLNAGASIQSELRTFLVLF